jgi:hypothetical protein
MNILYHVLKKEGLETLINQLNGVTTCFMKSDTVTVVFLHILYAINGNH